MEAPIQHISLCITITPEPMGNTPSSPTSLSPSPLQREPSFISKPYALLRRSRSHHRQLGPEHVISPYTEQSSPSTQDPSPTASRSSISKRPYTDTRALATHASVALGHRRSQTLAGSQANQHHYVGAIDVRRARSANVAGPSKAERTSEFLGAPPPYSPVDSSLPSLHGSRINVNDGFLDVPRDSHREKGHRRSASEETSGHRRTPTNRSDDTEYEELVPEEFGYGVGNGMTTEYNSDRMRRLPPIPTEAPYSERMVPSLSSRPPPVQNREDPLELLKQYKTIFIIDDSSSMAGERWAETREALASLADTAARYGTEGLDAYFLNANRSAQNMRSAASVKRQFDSVEPHGISLLARRLEELLNDYIAELEQAQRDMLRGDLHALRRIKPVNYIIITDGVPTDDPEAVIIQAARRLDRGNLPVAQVGIQFVQVGDDPRATEALREMDDEIAKEYGVRDMVDTTPYTGGPLDSELLIKILLGGINRRVDKKGARSIM